MSDHVRVSVIDRGPGIPAEFRDQIFEPFFTTRPVGQGSGLGLAVSRGLVERLDGSLTCVAPEADVGACFEFLLPLTPRVVPDPTAAS